MKTLSVLLVIFYSGLVSAYSGANSTEASLRFSHWVDLDEGERSLREVREKIEFQLDHLFGPLSESPVAGAPKLDHEIPEASIKIVQRSDGTWMARYNYSGTVVLQNGPLSQAHFVLPNDPGTIFATSEENKRGMKNPCTHDYYQDVTDFWYFWSPARPGCSQVLKGRRDYNQLKAQVIRRPNSRQTYPEYRLLPDRNKRVVITLLMGKAEPHRFRSPYDSNASAYDENAENFQLMAEELEALGFKSRVWSLPKIQSVVKQRTNPYPFVQEFSLKYDGERAREIIVNLVYAQTEIDRRSSTGFHYFFEHALERSAIMIYDGHSALGGNLDIQRVRQAEGNVFRINLNKKRYQIFFLNSCTSYAYFNDMFFAMKQIPGSRDRKGSRFLDVLTTGLETAFQGSVATNLALIKAVHTWALAGEQTSYQTLAEEMENGNLFGVNGDEDNPTRPL